MTTTMTTADLPRAEASLRAAVASGSEKRIDAAGRRLIHARDAAARRTQRARDREAARLAVEQEKRDRERADQKEKADKVEADLRRDEPYCEVHAGGRVVRIRLAHEDSLGRGTAVEAVRRVVFQAVHRFNDMVVASRGALAPQRERDWIAELSGSSAGLLPAEKMGLVTITDEEDAAERG